MNAMRRVSKAFTTDYAPKFEENDEVNTVIVKMTGNQSKGYVVDEVNIGDKEPIDLNKIVDKELVLNQKGNINSKAIKKAVEATNSKSIPAEETPDAISNAPISNAAISNAAISNAPNRIDDETSGGYDAMKRSRSVGSKRKTIRQAKRHARRSRRSRPSRVSL